VLLNIENVGRFWIMRGSEVVADPLEGVDLQTLRLFFLGSCMGVVLMQRGVLSLHGSAVKTDKGAVVFLGGQGAGKSTLAVALARKGLPLLSDDLCPLGNPEAPLAPCRGAAPRENRLIPSYPQMKLQEKTLAAVGESKNDLRKMPSNRGKYFFPVEKFHRHPTPVHRIYLLAYGDSIQIARLPSHEQVEVLMAHTYRPGWFRKLFDPAAHFQRSVAVCASNPVFLLTRPYGLNSLNEIVRTLTCI
jgi:hypothetical protein